MNTNADEFVAWSLHPERTVEERFGVLLLVETIQRRGVPFDFDRMRAAAEARRLNPAWTPHYTEADLRAVAEILPQITDWGPVMNHDRPLRDLSVVRFLPELTSFRLDHGSEATDLTPLTHCPRLVRVSLSAARTLEDFRPLAHCRGLQNIRVYTQFPWPRMEGWEALEHLTELHWTGPGTGFLGLSALPALEQLILDTGGHHHGGAASLRDFHQLPVMPRLRLLWGTSFYYLHGIERFPALESLMVKGPLRTAAPAAALPALRHLLVSSNELREVQSLVEAPALESLVIEGERPLDYTPLMDAQRLREVLSFGCEHPQMELGAVQAVLPGWDDVFLTPQPRPLAPLRLTLRDRKKQPPDPMPDFLWPVTDDPLEQNPCWQRHARLWVLRHQRSVLDASGLTAEQGVRLAYGTSQTIQKAYTYTSAPGHENRDLTVRLLGTRAIACFRHVVQTMREMLASLRHPWRIQIIGIPDPDDDDYEREWVRGPRDELIEEKYREEQARKHQAYLAREFRLQLLRAEGQSPDPGRFAPAPPPPANTPPPAAPVDEPEEEDEEDESDGIPFDPPNLDWSQRPDDDHAGGIKEADPENPDDDHDEQWLPPPPHISPNVFWDALRFFVYLTEESLTLHEESRDVMAYLLARE